MVNETVVSQHAEEAAFLWTMRDRAVGEPHYSLDDIAALDERVEAHLDGLRVAGDVGWKFCKVILDNFGPGEVFATSVIAFGGEDRDRMREALLAGCTSPQTAPGLVSALAWLEWNVASPWVQRLLEAKSAAHRAVGVAACAAHRHDPEALLAAAVRDSDPALRARALRAAGELKRHDLSHELRRQLRADDEAGRFWAAWALTLSRERDGLSALASWYERGDALGDRARQLGLRAMPLEEGRTWVSSLVKKAELAKAAVVAAGVVGDPASIPWLVRRMEDRELARLAGEAFTMITGVDLAYNDLDQDPPASEAGAEADIEDVLDLDYESNLPWPAPSRVEEWWASHQASFTPGVRYLAGAPISAAGLRETLRSGKQRLRAAAALELALLNREQPLFEVRARGNWQQRSLASWSS